MRLVFLTLVAPLCSLILTSASIHAQQPPAPGTRPARETAGPSSRVELEIPVSLERIREALAQPPPAEPLRGLDEQPTFRLEVLERQKIQQLMDSIRFEGGGGPEVAGGRANHELQQLLFPKVDNPLVQPYAAFSTSEVMTLAGEALIENFVTHKVSHVFSDMLKAQAEREAREEVARALMGLQRSPPAIPPGS
jgi:hypothetical protein